MQDIYLYNTYHKQKEKFISINENKVKMYTCGPTVYDKISIGNLHAYISADIIRRTLEYIGYNVKQVMNITDVGHLTLTDEQKEKHHAQGGHSKDIEITDTDDGIDRMEKAAKREGLTVWEIAEKYIEPIFGSDYKTTDKFSSTSIFGKINLKKPSIICRATDHIAEQIELIKKLEQKGYTYTTKQAVYFDVTKYPKYEKLNGQKFEDMQTGVRNEVNIDPEIKNPADFRLWQLNQPNHAMLWESPWGVGYPGWHIECSAMAMKHLGDTLDIHTGGEDHIKIHHVNEQAQSESATGKTFANYWLHNSFISVDGKRMGKSLGNTYTVKDLEDKGFSGLDLRYLYLNSHYKTKTNFTWEALTSAKNALEKLNNKITEFNTENTIKTDSETLNQIKTKFNKSVTDDFNMPQALAVVWELVKDDNISSIDKKETIKNFDKVLGLKLGQVNTVIIPEDILELVEKRKQAREEKNWEESDKLRAEIENLGYTIKDTDTGFDISKK